MDGSDSFLAKLGAWSRHHVGRRVACDSIRQRSWAAPSYIYPDRLFRVNWLRCKASNV